jgi:hypothetical protein
VWSVLLFCRVAAMCQELKALRDAIKTYAGRLDASTLSPAQADEVVGLCAQIEASISSLKALAAARSAESDTWKTEGYRSPAERLARRAGMSPGAARRVLDTGRRMAVQPEVSRAARAGQLTAEQAAAVSDAVAASPGMAGELLAKAGHLSVPELNVEAARAKAVADDEEGRRRRITAKRSFRWWPDRDGALQGRLYGPVADGLDLTRMLDPIRRRLHQMYRDAGRPVDSFEALDYDALRVITATAIGRESDVPVSELLDLGLFSGFAEALAAAPPGGGLPTPVAGGCDRAGATAGPLGDSGGTAGVSPTGPTSAGPAWTGAGATSAGSPSAGSLSAAGRRPPNVPPPVRPGQGDLFAPIPDTPSDETRLPAVSTPEVAADPLVRDGGRRPRPPKPGRKLAGRPTQIMIRIDIDTLLRGRPLDGELCEIAGIGPIPVSAVEDILASDNPFLIGIMTRGRDIVGVAHLGRRPTAHQRSALDFIHPTCAAAGCNARTGLQYDHRIDWAKTKYTLYDQLDRLCTRCHDLKTHRNWALVSGRGKRPLVPPDDPRHPCHRERGRSPGTDP